MTRRRFSSISITFSVSRLLTGTISGLAKHFERSPSTLAYAPPDLQDIQEEALLDLQAEAKVFDRRMEGLLKTAKVYALSVYEQRQ